MNRQIILASQSKQRYKALRSLGINFEVIPANIDEQAVKAVNAVQRARQVAMAKAQRIAEKYPQAIVIAGDTYGVFKDKFFEKPQSLEEAERMLQELSGQEFQALTGFAYLDLAKNLSMATVKVVEVKMRQLSNYEIKNYVNSQPVLTWSAAFCPAYDSGAILIERMSGSYTGFTYGIPIEEVAKYLTKSGVLT